MNKLSIFVFLSVALVSCSKETILSEEPDGGNQMTFSVSSAQARAVLGVNGVVSWTKGDAISIIDGAFESTSEHHNKRFTAKSIGTSSEFDGKCDDVDTYYAVSPYFAFQAVGNSSLDKADPSTYFNLNTRTAANVITTILPYRQKACSGTFDPDALVMVGKSSSTNKRTINMKQLCGLVKFTLSSSSDIKEIEFEGNNDEKLCGPVAVKFNDSGEPVLDTSISDKYYGEGFGKELFLNHVTLVPASGSTIADGTYFISLPPTNFTGSFTFRLKKTDGTIAEKVGKIPINLNRAGIIDIGTIDCSSLKWNQAIEIPFYLYPRQKTWKFPLSTAAAAVAPPVFNGYYSITKWVDSTASDKWPAGGTNALAWLNQEKAVKVMSVPWLENGYTFTLFANKYITPHEINGLRMQSTSAKATITFPGITGKKLVKIAVRAGNAINNLCVVDGEGKVISGGEACTLALGQSHSYNLSGTTAGAAYKLSTTGMNIRTMTLYYSE